MSEVQKATAIVVPQLKVLLYGPPGSGKTIGAATLPGSKLIIDFDHGVLPLRGRADVDFIQPATLAEFAALPDNLLDNYDVIILDSLTTFSNSVMSHVMTVNKKSDPLFITQAEWGFQQRLVEDTLSRITKLRKHVCVTAHQHLDKDEVTGRAWGLPLVTGKLAQRVGIYFDEMYHTETSQSKENIISYWFLTKPDGLFVAKSRIGLPMRVDVTAPHGFGDILEIAKAAVPQERKV